MDLPSTNYDPSFRITRMSHVVLTARDLQASKHFYTEVVGLVVSREEEDALYLRGVAETCHHSLVLRKDTVPRCARIGLRVMTEADLDRAKIFFDEHHCETAWVEVPYQNRTLHVTDVAGVPIELCASMAVEKRRIVDFPSFRGGAAQRIDHVQIMTPQVREVTEFYLEAGFRLTEYIAPADHSFLGGAFLQRKGNPHDMVFFYGAGPRLHHFAYVANEVHHLLHACDVAGALGYGLTLERGPGRHGAGHALFIYFRDPDGHRVELFNTHYQTMDIEDEQVRWEPGDPAVSNAWGMPAQRIWFEEATEFAGITPQAPPITRKPVTLEAFLENQRK